MAADTAVVTLSVLWISALVTYAVLHIVALWRIGTALQRGRPVALEGAEGTVVGGAPHARLSVTTQALIGFVILALAGMGTFLIVHFND